MDFDNGSTCVKFNIAVTNDSQNFLEASTALAFYFILLRSHQ